MRLLARLIAEARRSVPRRQSGWPALFASRSPCAVGEATVPAGYHDRAGYTAAAGARGGVTTHAAAAGAVGSPQTAYRVLARLKRMVRRNERPKKESGCAFSPRTSSRAPRSTSSCGPNTGVTASPTARRAASSSLDDGRGAGGGGSRGSCAVACQPGSRSRLPPPSPMSVSLSLALVQRTFPTG